jgi:hypothetical protein
VAAPGRRHFFSEALRRLALAARIAYHPPIVIDRAGRRPGAAGITGAVEIAHVDYARA